MIHPFMPFLSEELWQRLPRRQGDSTISIVKARYPEYKAEFDDAESAAQYELLINCSKGLRSLMAEFGIKKDATGTSTALPHCVHPILINGSQGYISCTDSKDFALLKAELMQARALAGKTFVSLTLLEEGQTLPPGCAVYPVSSVTTVYVDVGSHVDVSSLLGKTEAKLAKANEAADRQRKTMAMEGWADKVSEAIKDAEEEKLVVIEAQMKSLASSIEQFKRLDIK
jgi:valyl-tRNA synthetase